MTARLLVLSIMLVSSQARADVYISMHDRGLVRFDGKRARTIVKRPRFVHAVVPDGQGSFWIGALLVLHRLSSGALDEGHDCVPLHVRTSPSGAPWYANNKEVGWFDGTWHSLSLPSNLGLSDFEVDGQGRAWIIADGKLHYTTGRGWTTLVTPGDGDVKHCQLATQGDLYVACWEDVYRLHDNSWSTVGKLDRVAVSDLVVTADGTIHVRGVKAVHVLRPNEEPRTFTIPNWYVRAFEVDGRGRVWVGHDDGLAVYGTRGTRLRLPRALATRDTVHAIHVEGDGPAF